MNASLIQAGRWERELRFGGGRGQMSLHLDMADVPAFLGILGKVSSTFVKELQCSQYSLQERGQPEIK